MTGATRNGGVYLPIVTDKHWLIGDRDSGLPPSKPIGTDFDGDGKPDILWRNSSTGEVMVWYMNGVTYTAAMLDSVTDQNMEIAGESKLRDSPELGKRSQITAIVDDAENAGQISTAVSQADSKIGILVDVNLGGGKLDGVLDRYVEMLLFFGADVLPGTR
jgi:hypothetical protein